MEEFLDIKNIITILVALSAGLFALVQVKINAITKARIDWIENLRQSLCEYYNSVINTTDYVFWICSKFNENKEIDEPNKSSLSSSKEGITYLKNLSNVSRLGNEIKLYLNSKEPEHQNIEKYIDSIYDILTNARTFNNESAEIDLSINRINLEAKTIIKKEWNKAKHNSLILYFKNKSDFFKTGIID